MTVGAWRSFKFIAGFWVIGLTIGLVLMASVSQAGGDEDSLRISAVRTYLARQIDSGERAGYFLHVWAHVLMSEATRERISPARNLPKYLVPRLEVNGRQLLPCGVGGRLPQMWPPFRSQEPGEPIAPLFFLPENTRGDVSLIVAVERRSERLEPLARASVSWQQGLLDDAEAARVQLFSVKTEETPSHMSQKNRLMQAVRLRLYADLTRVLGGGSGKIQCGNESAQELSPDVVADIVIAWFDPPVDAGNCRWELRFPALGVKLELKQESDEVEFHD